MRRSIPIPNQTQMGLYAMKVRRLGMKLSRHRSRTPSPASWTKSTLSMANGNCVEVAGLAGGLPGGLIMVRDSKDAKGLALGFTSAEWDAFIGGVRNGEFDRTRAPESGL